jgi:hypothetical protein
LCTNYLNFNIFYIFRYFLEELGMGLSWAGTRAVKEGESWKGAVDAFLINLVLDSGATGSCGEVKCLIRVDRWLVPGSNRMATHAVFLVYISQDELDNLVKVSMIIYYY